MGSTLSQPIKNKFIDTYGDCNYTAAAVSMQGYRLEMEDTHTICTIDAHTWCGNNGSCNSGVGSGGGTGRGGVGTNSGSGEDGGREGVSGRVGSGGSGAVGIAVTVDHSSSFSCPPFYKPTPPPPLPAPPPPTTCKLCCASEGDMLLLPCGHAGFCKQCCDSVMMTTNSCPICRSEIHVSSYPNHIVTHGFALNK